MYKKAPFGNKYDLQTSIFYAVNVYIKHMLKPINKLMLTQYRIIHYDFSRICYYGHIYIYIYIKTHTCMHDQYDLEEGAHEYHMLL